MDIQNETVHLERKKSFWRQAVDTVIYFGIILVVVLLVQRFIIQPVEVNGSSMETTLSDTDHLLLEKVSYTFSNPKRFDVIVFQPYQEEEDLYYIKRIIGLPGETVQIIDNIIYINGNPLFENYGKENIIRDPGLAREPMVLGDDEYFVLGDNRNNSKDSRDGSVGSIKSSSILGRAWCRIWPLNKLTFIKHK